MGDFGGSATDWGSFLSGIAQTGANTVGMVANNRNAQTANQINWQEYVGNQDFAREMATSAQQFSERMAGSAHQREVEDLKKAGINPMMTAMGGNGAPSPTGTSASSGSTPMEPNLELGKGLSNLVGNALSAARAISDIKNMDRDTALKEATALTQTAYTQQALANARQAEEATTQMARARNASAAEADARENKAKLDKTWNATERYLNMGKQVSGIANDASSSISNLLPTQAVTKNLGKTIDQAVGRHIKMNGWPIP